MRLGGGRAGPLGQTLAAMAVSSCFAAPALANPTGHHVVRGTADIHRVGNLLQITNSPNAIINWQSFSIGANEITRFIQQSPSSAVLNRVTTQNPSQILGALQSNGRVFLINPNGILFGAGAQVDVAGLVASTLNMSDQDFLAGRLRFTDGLGKSVVNDGSIATGPGGSVYLFGSGVTNNGIIRSPQGEVILAAGNSVELVNPGTPNLRVEVVAADNAARNLGQIVADAGRIGIYAGLVTQSGTVRADSAVAEGGRIILKATKNATLEAGSVTSASGATGGSITVQSGDTTLVAGVVEVTGTEGKGGSVQALGNLVGVAGNARIDASGDAGGGTVLVGGDFQGKNLEVQNAFRTYFGPDATIRADAVTSGDGGKVIVWADDVTRAYGSVSARGGARAGNGGFVEISGKGYLDFGARVNVGAANGAAGTLLLDPLDIVISNTTTTDNNQLNANTPAAGNPAGAIFFGDASGATFTISDEALEAQTGNIVLQASRDITVNNNLSGGGLNLTNQGSGERVVMQAGRDITIGSPVTTAGAAIILEADSGHAPTTGSADGRNPADGEGQLFIGARVASNGGKITLIGGGNPIQSGGGIGFGSSASAVVEAGAGGIDVALSGNADLGVGSLGIITQILGNPVQKLHTTGALVLGSATTAGTNGLGSGEVQLLANSISNVVPNSAIILSNAPASTASSFTLAAGDGGITLGQTLLTFQETTITTTGPLTINQTVNTTNNNLTINAPSVTLGPGGSIITGSGTLTCSVPVAGCSPTGVLTWDGGAGTSFWFDAANWSSNSVPTGLNDVSISSGFGTILVNGDAAAKSLTSLSPLEIPGGDSLTLINSSNFASEFRLTGGSLTTNSLVTVGGASGSMLWSGGVIGGPGGTFELGAGSSGTFTGSLMLNLPFLNSGALTLSGATIGGSGSIANAGTLTAAGASNFINVALANLASLGTVQALGSLTLANFPTNDGRVIIDGGATLSTNGASLANSTTGVIEAAGTLDLGGSGTFSNAGTATFDGAYNVAATNASGGTLTFNGAASTATLNLSGGTVTGAGDLSVTTDFNQAGGALGATFSDLVLNRSGNFIVDAAGIAAVDSVTLIAGAGITLNGSVTASNGTGDAIVLAGNSFTNNAGASALNPGAGRWLVWSSHPASDNRGGLTYGFKQYGADFGSTTVLGSGNGFLYSVEPTVTPTLVGTTTKVYDGTLAATLAAANYATSGAIDGDTVVLNNPSAATYADRNFGSGKNVSTSGIAISGATDGTGATVYGYQLTSSGASGNVGSITKRPITVTAASDAKVYDATTASAASPTITAGSLVGGDTATFVQAFDNKNVGTGKALTASAAVSDGNAGNNYAVTYVASNTGSITPATLTYAANAASRERGDPNPALSGMVTGFVGGETLATATTGTLGFVTPATQSSLEGQYAINGAGLTASNGNYVFAQAAPNATALSITQPVNFTWTALAGGDWDLGSNWNKGFAPVSGAVVTIPDLTGSVIYSSASGVTSVKSVTSLEGLTVAGGTLNLGASPADVSTFPVLTLSGGTLGGSGTLNVPSLNMSGGTLTGGLQIAANISNMAGTITPGSSPGSMVINGNYAQGPNGTLLMEIAGPASSQYDQLIVNGNATLGGTLRVNLLGGYVPADGETFTFVQSTGTVSGTFTNTAFPSHPGFNAGYLPASMFVAVSSIVIPPAAAVASASQVLVALTDQNQNTLVASQATGTPIDGQDQPQQQEQQQALRKKPMCGASNGGGGGGGGGLAGGGGFRCNTRGCF